MLDCACRFNTFPPGRLAVSIFLYQMLGECVWGDGEGGQQWGSLGSLKRSRFSKKREDLWLFEENVLRRRSVAPFLTYFTIGCIIINVYKVMKGLLNTCHNYRTEGFQIPIKPFLFENLDLVGNPVVTLCGTVYFLLPKPV